MIDKLITLLENPFVIIGLTAIIIVVLLTQKGLVGKILRKYLKLNTDDETLGFVTKMQNTKALPHKKILEQYKSDLIGGRPDDR